MITIRHTHEEGTLLDGSTKGDGVLDIVKGHGFRWFPSIRAIGIRQSRDHIAKRRLINAAADALRAAGHEVTVDIDDTPRGRAEVLADQAGRLDDRRDALESKAARRAGEAEASWNLSDRLVEHIPLGQPILVGHHSERRHRRTLERSQNAAFKAVALGAEAETVARRADAVGRDAASAATPAATRLRIQRLEAELRDVDRKLAGYTDKWGSVHTPATPGGDWELTLSARRAQLHIHLDHDRAVVAAAVEAGTLSVWDRSNVHVGDRVSRSGNPEVGTYHVVKKVNRVSVSVPTGYSWDDKIPFVEIRQVRCTHAEATTRGAA